MDSIPIRTPRRYDTIYSAHFDIVHGCQLRCLGCPNSTLQPKIKRIAVEDFATCMGNIDVRAIHNLRLFNYGEPLLHRELAAIVEQIPRQKWSVDIVEISTNGQKVYWDDFEDMMKLGVLDKLVVSCDGDGTPEDYERLRPPSTWDKFIEFLERAREIRDRHSPKTELWTRTVLNDAEHGERWRKTLEPRGWKPEFRGWMNLPEAVSNPSGRESIVPEGACFFMAEPEEFLISPWEGDISFLYADWDGTVVPCCQHPQAGILGNLMEQTYNEIMNGLHRQQFIHRMNTDRRNMAICGQCDMGPAGNEGPSFESVLSMKDPAEVA